MSEYSRRYIVEAIAAIPAPERTDVIQHARQLITPEMYVYDRIRMISNVAAVPMADRANYVRDRKRGRGVNRQTGAVN
jgi:hypothetical protein